MQKELTKLGYKTKYGNSQWHDTGVLGIIKNEKYKGDVLQGKTFTVDPISKRRLDNYGEEDQFYIKIIMSLLLVKKYLKRRKQY